MHILFLSVSQSRVAGRIMFLTCPFVTRLSVRLSVRLFVCYRLANAILRAQMNRFQCKCHKSSPHGNGMNGCNCSHVCRIWLVYEYKLTYCGLRGESLVWLIGAMVCLLAAPWFQLSVSAGSGWPHNALQHHCLTKTWIKPTTTFTELAHCMLPN